MKYYSSCSETISSKAPIVKNFFKLISLLLLYIPSFINSRVMVEIQNFKRIDGGFDLRDFAFSGAGFLLKFTHTP